MDPPYPRLGPVPQVRRSARRLSKPIQKLRARASIFVRRDAGPMPVSGCRRKATPSDFASPILAERLPIGSAPRSRRCSVGTSIDGRRPVVQKPRRPMAAPSAFRGLALYARRVRTRMMRIIDSRNQGVHTDGVSEFRGIRLAPEFLEDRRDSARIVEQKPRNCR